MIFNESYRVNRVVSYIYKLIENTTVYFMKTSQIRNPDSWSLLIKWFIIRKGGKNL